MSGHGVAHRGPTCRAKRCCSGRLSRNRSGNGVRRSMRLIVSRTSTCGEGVRRCADLDQRRCPRLQDAHAAGHQRGDRLDQHHGQQKLGSDRPAIPARIEHPGQDERRALGTCDCLGLGGARKALSESSRRFLRRDRRHDASVVDHGRLFESLISAGASRARVNRATACRRGRRGARARRSARRTPRRDGSAGAPRPEPPPCRCRRRRSVRRPAR